MRSEGLKVLKSRGSGDLSPASNRTGGMVVGGHEVTPDHVPSHSRARGLSRRDPFQVPGAQDFQVLLSLQAITLGKPLPSTTGAYPHPSLGRLRFLFSSSAPFRWGSPCWRPRSWWESTLTPMAVRVGEQRRVTTPQGGTNCPFCNEVGVAKMEGGLRE